MSLNRKVLARIPAIALLALLVSCKRAPGIRHYEEVLIGKQANAISSLPNTALAWTVPEGWAEQPPSGQRLATFLVGVEQAECTITSFPGDVGGIEANIQRWLGQLHVDLSGRERASFLQTARPLETVGGLSGLFFDFGPLVLEHGGETSMLATLLRRADTTVFIKLTGSPNRLAAEQDHFLQLSSSIR